MPITLMMVNAQKEAKNLAQGCDNPVNGPVDSDVTMNAERFDDAVAAVTFTAMAITIALGFLLHL